MNILRRLSALLVLLSTRAVDPNEAGLPAAPTITQDQALLALRTVVLLGAVFVDGAMRAQQANRPAAPRLICCGRGPYIERP
jgi:hypothetical protein